MFKILHAKKFSSGPKLLPQSSARLNQDQSGVYERRCRFDGFPLDIRRDIQGGPNIYLYEYTDDDVPYRSQNSGGCPHCHSRNAL